MDHRASHHRSSPRAINEELDLVAQAPWRNDSTPSLHVWPPGTGRFPDSWTWYDYGDRVGGTVVGYLQRARNLSYDDAVSTAWSLLGGKPGAPSRPARSVAPVVSPTLSPADMRTACGIIGVVTDGSQADADAYLRTVRGLDPVVARTLGDFRLVRSRDDARRIGRALKDSPAHEHLLAAGLAKPGVDAKGCPRWLCWDKSLLIGCHDESGTVIAWHARRCEWSATDPLQLPKYLNQAGEQLPRPFGLLQLAEAARTGGELIVCEAALDTVGARMLGHRAIGMRSRPGTTNPETYAATSQAAWFTQHLPAFQSCSRVIVLPDNDPGDVGQVGMECAKTAAAWFRLQGVRAEEGSMAALGYGDHKDLAKAAQEICRPA